MQLDHVTIVARDTASMRAFFVDIAGLRVGPRPPFHVDGFWLYLGDRPVIHLVRSTSASHDAISATRIDHVAFRVDDSHAWNALIGRLHDAPFPFQTTDVPTTNERQLFVRLSPTVTVEFVTSIAPS